MKLKEMNRKQLVKAAAKVDLHVFEEWSDVQLRKSIRVWMRVKSDDPPTPGDMLHFGDSLPKNTFLRNDSQWGKEEAKPKRNEKKAAKATWPAEWPEEMHESYYMEIVGETMPANPATAYKKLNAAIEKKVPDVEPIRILTGFSCFGLWHDPKLVQCSKVCKIMPLCARVCSLRPELAQQVEELEKAATEMEPAETRKSKRTRKAKESLPEAEAEAEAAPVAEDKPKRKKRKAVDPEEEGARSIGFTWCGDITEYEEMDPDLMKVYAWLAKPSRKKPRVFTHQEVSDRLATSFEDSDALATQLIDALLDEGDIKRYEAQ